MIYDTPDHDPLLEEIHTAQYNGAGSFSLQYSERYDTRLDQLEQATTRFLEYQPEFKLWGAVLRLAIRDAFAGESQALHWLLYDVRRDVGSLYWILSVLHLTRLLLPLRRAVIEKDRRVCSLISQAVHW